MAQTLAEIREALKVANRVEYEALARALAADERKGVKAALKSTARRLAAEDAEALPWDLTRWVEARSRARLPLAPLCCPTIRALKA